METSEDGGLNPRKRWKRRHYFNITCLRGRKQRRSVRGNRKQITLRERKAKLLRIGGDPKLPTRRTSEVKGLRGGLDGQKEALLQNHLRGHKQSWTVGGRGERIGPRGCKGHRPRETERELGITGPPTRS